jgi:8-oxo-dGTP diphosphatase
VNPQRVTVRVRASFRARYRMARSLCDPSESLSTLGLIDSEIHIMTLSPPAGQKRTKQLSARNRGPDCGSPLGKPVPRVDVRVVLFTVRDKRALVALQEQPTCQALPRGSPTLAESFDTTATRILIDHVGIAERYLEQLYSISHSSEGDWTVTVTYLALALAGASGPPLNSATWFDGGNLPEMNPVDRKIIDYALVRLRAKLGYTTIAFHLLPPSFSLSELQIVYEAVLGHEVDKRNFRRRIHAAAVLEGTGETRREGSHRPARLYKFRASHDPEVYLTPAWAFAADQEAPTL